MTTPEIQHRKWEPQKICNIRQKFILDQVSKIVLRNKLSCTWDGFQAKAGPSCLTGSEVDWSWPSRLKTRIRRTWSTFETNETAKYCPSSLQTTLIDFFSSSFSTFSWSICPTVLDSLPAFPWNWVSLVPQPTLTLAKAASLDSLKVS